jgi:hypothetical protein
VIGFIVGGGIYASTYQKVFPKVSKIADYGAAVIPDLWNISAWSFILFFTTFVLLLFNFFRLKEL